MMKTPKKILDQSWASLIDRARKDLQVAREKMRERGVKVKTFCLIDLNLMVSTLKLDH